MSSVPQATYQVYLYSVAGNLVRVLTDWTKLSYTRRINEPGSYQFTCAEDSGLGLPLSALPTYLVEDAIVVVRRRIPEVGTWYTDLTAFHRDESYDTDADGGLAITSRGVGTLDLIARRVVAYPAGTRQTGKDGASMTSALAIYEFVTENAGALATTGNGRYADGQTTGLSVNVPSGTFADWAGARHMQNVLGIIQGISAETQDVEFEMLTTVGSGSVAHVFNPVARIGTDRSASAIFSKSRGNVAAPTFSRSRSASRNRAYVLGPGEQSDRIVLAVNDASAQAVSPWALSEMTREATQEQSWAALANLGAAAIEGQRMVPSYTFTPIETQSTRYGRDYYLGDTVTAVVDDGSEVVLRIVGVTLTSDGGDSGAEGISLDVTIVRP